MRYFIETNNIEHIIEFYNKYVLINSTCTNTGAISFEGFYINENILGLVNSLKGRLSKERKPIVGPNSLMRNFFSENMGNKGVIFPGTQIDIYKDEYIAQTYFIRNLLREDLVPGNNIRLLQDNNTHLLSNAFLDAYSKVTYQTGNTTKTIKQWVEESYDFNKSYTDKPPIATFMEAYFGKEAEGTTDVINNFYLFYVVSNRDYSKCANQIKLISDSDGFIEAIKNYEPSQ
jgi:hypothetical protein